MVRIDFARREELLESYSAVLTVPPRTDSHRTVVLDINGTDPGLISTLLDEAWTLQTG